MRTYIGVWSCMCCPEGGAGAPKDTDKAAEKHTKATGHGTESSMRPPRTK